MAVNGATASLAAAIAQDIGAAVQELRDELAAERKARLDLQAEVDKLKTSMVTKEDAESMVSKCRAELAASIEKASQDSLEQYRAEAQKATVELREEIGRCIAGFEQTAMNSQSQAQSVEQLKVEIKGEVGTAMIDLDERLNTLAATLDARLAAEKSAADGTAEGFATKAQLAQEMTGLKSSLDRECGERCTRDEMNGKLAELVREVDQKLGTMLLDMDEKIARIR